MNCSKCGRKIPSHSKFCLYCGEKVLEEQQPLLEPVVNEKIIDGIRIKDDPISRRRIGEAIKIYYGWFQNELAKKIDFSVRPIQWIGQDGNYRGELNSFIGEVRLQESCLFWSAHVKNAQRRFYQTEIFAILAEALDWAEKTISEAKDMPIVEPQPSEVFPPVFELTDEYRERLADYWITPASLEPEQITYEAIIDLVHIPESYTSITLDSGEVIRGDERYPSAANLAVNTGLGYSKLNCEEWTSGRFRVNTLTHFYRSQDAIAEAQHIWGNSKIIELFKAGKILKARYGYREIETGYTTYLGECVLPGETWIIPSSRETYLQDRALHYTLIYALDVAGYRSRLQLTYDITDDEILHMLHEQRSKCKYIPASASAESLQWLRAKELEDRKTSSDRNRTKGKS